MLYRAGHEAAAQHVALALSFRGPLQPAKLASSFADLVRVHDALRARLGDETEGEGRLLLNAAPLAELPIHSVVADPPAKAGSAAGALAADPLQAALVEHIAEPLALDQRCFSARLFRNGEREHVLSFVGHRVAFDETSLAVLARDLIAYYEGSVVASPAPGTALAGYLWKRQRERRQTGWALEIERRAEPLRGELPALDLPLDHARPPIFSGRAGTRVRRLDVETTAQLNALAQARGASQFDLAISAFFAFAQRWANASDIVIGLERAAERALERGLIGPMTPVQVQRLSLEAGTSVATVINAVAEAHRAHLTRPTVDLQDLVRALAVPRDRGRPSVFQISVQADVAFAAPVTQGELVIERLETPVVGLRTDLHLRLRPVGDQLSVAFDYARDLFSAESVDRMLDGFVVALTQLAQLRDLSMPIGRLPVMTPQDRARALSLVDTRPTDTRPTFLRFEEHVAKTPNAVAVVFQGQRLSYAELNARANRVAHRLIQSGVEKDTLVGVYCERSFDMLIAVLGVMKAGGAYVPLDPAHPPARTQTILEDSKIRALLTQGPLLARAPTSAEVTKLLLDDPTLELEPEHNPDVVVDSDALAYVIFTSGSTGRPKGVGIEHRALTNFLVSMAHTPGYTPKDRILSVTTLSFDIAGLELHLPLSVGGSVEIADRATSIDSQALAARLADPEITMLQATPASFRLLLKNDWPGKGNLKILCGGEAFPPDLIEALLPRVAEIWNMYGPTETTIWSTTQRLTHARTPVSIGGPIDNTTCYVLSPLLELVPCGAIGELYLGGDGVARGYYERPELTSQRFVPDPFSDKPGARMYQTGDLARMLPDDTLTCLGRVDFQVKIRGFRIEIGEIEKALLACAGVAQGVVTAWEPEPGDKRLVAYVVMRDDTTVNDESLADALRGDLSRVLPSYMVPAFFLRLDTLPLNPSGKVDRKALPPPSAAAALGGSAPGTLDDDIEAQIHGVFTRVLGVPHVNAEDSFFEAGGDSILAVRLSRELKNELGAEVPLVALFETPSIRGLAKRLRSKTAPSTTTARVVALRRGNGTHKLFCISGIALYQHLAHALPKELTVLGVYVPAEAAIYDADTLRRGHAAMPMVETLAGQYAQVIRREQPSGPYRIAGVSFGGVLAYEIARQLESTGEKVVFLGLFDALLPHAFASTGLTRLLIPVKNNLKAAVKGGPRRSALAKLLAARAMGGSSFDFSPHELEAVRDALHEVITVSYMRRMRAYGGTAVAVGALDRSAGGGKRLDASAGWDGVVKGGLARIELNGDHLGILRPPHVGELAAQLEPYLLLG